MKIVKWPEFARMEAGTVFSKYTPEIFDDMCIKGDTIYNDGEPIDFFYQRIHDSFDARDSGHESELIQLAEEHGASIPMDFDVEMRDGCFEHDQLYAVWENADVEALIKRLQRCIAP